MTRISPNISFRRTKQLHPRNTEKEMNKWIQKSWKLRDDKHSMNRQKKRIEQY